MEVFVIVQYLMGIHVVDFVIWNFDILCIWLENAYSHFQNLGDLTH